MAPAANIEINGVAATNDNLPINTLVQLSNADVGGEITYLWEILDQPAGAADALSSAVIENPTFTPKKEGTYLLRLTVNQNLATQVINTKVAAVRQLRTNERIPAALETLEVDSSKGWKPATNQLLQLLDKVLRDSNLMIVKMPAANVPALGGIVRYSSQSTFKTGLPGQEDIIVVDKALATTLSQVQGPLGVLIATPTGAAPAANGLGIVRRFGLVELSAAGAPVVLDPVYVSDTGLPALAAGTNSRKIGRVLASGGGNYRWMVDGGQGAWP